jgi:phage shock protein C
MTARSRLTRSNDRIIGGVCGGLAAFLGWAPVSVRALYVVVSVVSAAFPGIVAYLILWWMMPDPDEDSGFRLDDFRRQ